MQFWIRHAFLLLLCVALPFFAALYVDTHSEIRRAEKDGTLGAKFAAGNLVARLTLDAHKNVNHAIFLAQSIQDRDLVGELVKKPNATPAAEKRRDAAFASVVELLKAGAPEGGFAWLIDENGAILARGDATAPDDNPQMIAGHPLFMETQEGYALDGLWKHGEIVAMIGAAPVIVKSQAQGAVFVGAPLNRAMVDTLSSSLNVKVTLVVDEKVVASTLPPQTATDVIKVLSSSTEEVASGGALEQPLKHDYLPMLPLFIEHDARGFAFTSAPARVPGTDEVRWVVSAPSGEQLRGLPERQEIVLGGLGIFFMLALLIGMVNHRTFVRPIDKLTEHLSELTQGRGEMELPEGRVSAPFRRLVKLINMTVQRIPSRTFSTTRVPSAMESPIAEITSVPISTTGLISPPRPTLPPAPAITGSEAIDGLLPPAAPPAPRLATSSPEGRIAGPRQPSSLLEKHPFEGGGDLLADAVSSLARGGSSAPATPASTGEMLSRKSVSTPAKGAAPSADLDEADAIAQAIASLEGGNKPNATPVPPAAMRMSGTPVPPVSANARGSTSGFDAPKIPAVKTGVRSAADIRGKPSESLIGAPSPFSPSQSEMYRGSNVGPRTDSATDERTPIEAQMPAVARAHSTARSGGSLNLASYAGIGQSAPVEEQGFNPEATVVAPVADELLRKSASREDTTDHHAVVPQHHIQGGGDMTMVASVPPNLLAQTMGEGDGDGDGGDLAGLDAADHAHFKETYERFIEMRKRCGEATGDLAFDRFLAKLAKNREGLVKKYNCRTVRFQVYEKDGKAALKATPVRAR